MQEVSFWINEVDSCLKRRERELIKKNNYPLLLKYYEGDMARGDKTTNSERQAFINSYFPSINATIAEIMYRTPEIMTEPIKPQAEKDAPIMNAALKYAFNRVDALTENRVALFDMLFAGFCAVEVNHINDTGEGSEGETDGIVGKVRSLFKKADSQEKIEENLAKGQPEEEYNYSSPLDETYLRRWNPLDVILDYRAERLKDLRYIGKIIRMTPAEFNARYPKFKDKVTADSELQDSTHKAQELKKLITLYEIQIKKKGNRYVTIVISPSYKGGEIDMFERPYVTNGFNMKIGQLHDYGKLYPVSIAQINKGMQDDINNYVTFMMETAERNIPKRGINKNKVKSDGIAHLTSTKVNDTVECDGGPESVWTIPNTAVSLENKELVQIFTQQQEKLFNVSQARLQGKGQAKFATELSIQEAGFQTRQADIQEGLRKVMVQQVDTLKDIIATYWDDQVFLKVTGKQKPQWYEPIIVGGQVMNPLNEMLTSDYQVNIDITSALRPNQEKRKKDLIDYLSWLFDPIRLQWLGSMGKTINIEMINKTAEEFGLNPETLLVDLPEMPQEEPEPPEPLEIGEIVTKQTTEKADELGNKKKLEQTQKKKEFA